MRPPDISRLAALIAAAVLIPAASAAAAPPDKQATLSDTNPSYTWTGGPGSGVVYTSTVANRVGCNPVLFYCDFALLKTEVQGTLLLNADGDDDQTLQDIDLHLYMSDADGTQGELWDEATSAEPHESLAETELPPGYWLVRVDYYLGAGTYHGAANFTPDPVVTP